MSQIKYNNKTINKLEHNASEVKKMYYDSDVCYGGDGGSPEPPTPPSFDGKWLATYTGGTTSSAACGSSSAIINNEITKTDLISVEIGDCVTSFGQGAFIDCSSLTSVTIPDSVTSINKSVFGNCTALTSVTIPNSVTSIGESAFIGCSSLTSVTIPSGVTSIGGYAFEMCTGLTSITIPSGVTGIGNWTFGFCSGLTSITIEATTPPTLGGTSVFKNTNNCPIYVPSASLNTYKSASGWSSYASRIQSIPQ